MSMFCILLLKPLLFFFAYNDVPSNHRHVALLKIQGKDYQMEPIQLKTVRPFVYGDIILEEAREAGAKLDSKVAVNKFLKAKVR